MKKILLILVFFTGLCGVMAQNQVGIKFFHGSFEEAKAKAKSENKLIFIDFYTQWCGPCLTMAKNVFVVPEVGAFYNDNFICLKIDADSKDGKIIATHYVVKSYPNFLFVNADGLSVHCSIGRKSVEEFLAVGKAALDPEATSIFLNSEYEKGNRDQNFMISYVNYKYSVYDKEAVKIAFKEIIQNGGKLSDAEIWKLFVNCISGYNNPYFKELSDNYDSFVGLYGKETVDAKLAKETMYCPDDVMVKLCDFEGKKFNLRLRMISNHIFSTKNYSKAISSIDALITDTTQDKQKVIERLKFMIRLNKRYGPDYPDEWFFKCIEYLRYFAYNHAKRDDVRIHFDYALGLEMMLERMSKKGIEMPEFLKVKPEYGKTEYSSRPAELKLKPRYRKK